MLAINDSTGLAHIYGMHEGSGPVHYKRLVNGGMLDGQISGMDYASLPPGSLIGMHEHPDNAEIWVVLRGQGHIQHEETERMLDAGQTLYTPAGGRHSMVNPEVATAPIEFVVVTMMSPTDAPAKLPGSEVRTLSGGKATFPGFGDDRYTVELRDIAADEAFVVQSDTAQHVVYLVDGAGVLSWGRIESDLASGAALGIPATECVRIKASNASRLLVVRIEHSGFSTTSADDART